MKLGMFCLMLALSAVACTGSMEPLGGPDTSAGGDDDTTQPPPGGDPQPSGAKATFTSTVQPLLVPCGGCHSTQPPLGFLGTSGDAGQYDAIIASGYIDKANPPNSTLLTHTHASPAAEFDSAGKATVLAWIQEEAGQ